MNLARWGSIGFADYNTDTDEVRHWWNWSYENAWGGQWGDRAKIVIGDLQADSEHETGEPAGATFAVDLRLWEDVGSFHFDDNPTHHDHSIMIIVWRWGAYFAWRGGKLS